MDKENRILVHRGIAVNLPEELWQHRVTMSLICSYGALTVKHFITMQKTRMMNYAACLVSEVAAIDPYHINAGIGRKETFKGSPAIFGGATVNYSASSKLNLNMTAYYYSSQVQSHVSNIIYQDGIRGIDHIDPKLIINAAVTYEPLKGLQLFGAF